MLYIINTVDLLIWELYFHELKQMCTEIKEVNNILIQN